MTTKNIKSIFTKKENGEMVDVVIFNDNSAILIFDGIVYYQKDITSEKNERVFIERYCGTFRKYSEIKKGTSFIQMFFTHYIILGNGAVIDLDVIN